MWAYESVFYQIYPLGFCGAPFENDGVLEHRILKVNDWIPHIKKLGADAIYFSPVFESDTHGYNTRDYTKIDTRLGTNEDVAQVCDNLHKDGIKVVLDGVFNHVGRGFWAFQAVLLSRIFFRVRAFLPGKMFQIPYDVCPAYLSYAFILSLYFSNFCSAISRNATY